MQPRIVYRDIFNVSLREYYVNYGIYFVVFLISGALTFVLCSVLDTSSVMMNFIIRVAMCAIIPNLINTVVFWNTQEFGYVKTLVKRMISR